MILRKTLSEKQFCEWKRLAYLQRGWIKMVRFAPGLIASYSWSWLTRVELDVFCSCCDFVTANQSGQSPLTFLINKVF